MIKFYINRPSYIVQTDAPVLGFVYGEVGYWPIYTRLNASALNAADMTAEILASAEIGSMCGWEVEGAKLAKAYALAKEQEANAPIERIIKPNGECVEVPAELYIKRVEALELEGMTRSDAQGVADVEFLEVADTWKK